MVKKTNRRLNLYSLKNELLGKIEALEKRVRELEGVDRAPKKKTQEEKNTQKDFPEGVWDPSKTKRPEKMNNKKIIPTQMQSNEKVKVSRLDKKEKE